MKKFTLTFLLAIIWSSHMVGQDYFYVNGAKYFLEEAPHWTGVQVSNENLDMLLKEPDHSSLRIRQTLHRRDGIFWLEHREGEPIGTSLDQLREKVNIERIFPAYYRLNHNRDTIHYIIYDEFRVKFVDNISEEEIKQLNERYSVNIVASGFENEYTLKVDETRGLSTIEIANIYYENDLTIWSLPDFYTLIVDHSIQDPEFGNQWHLKNTGQGGGVEDVDINIIDAWGISLGEGITIAIIETGAAAPHEDFNTLNFIAGYHAINENRIINTSDYTGHATGVTGIIAAQHNTIGVRGVAPLVKIMPVVLGDVALVGQARIMQVSNAIDTAWYRNDGADIINNSWGFPHDTIYPPVRAAFQRAMSLGRGGKGTVMVAAAGNDSIIVKSPANIDSVLTVGAVTNTNVRASYSTDNSNLIDLVAPSGDTTTLRITTTGYTSDAPEQLDLINHYFMGTSAAAPQVSGVAALILSKKPEYTEKQVRNIILASATSDPGYGVWAGHGRLNATRALLYLNPQMSGPGIVCSGAQFTIGNIPDGSSIVWDWGPNLNLISGQGSNPATFSSTGNGMSWVEATIVTSYDTFNLNKDVWSGKPVFNSISGPNPPYYDNGCTGQPYTFWANPSRDPASQSSYQWIVESNNLDWYFQSQYQDWVTIVFNDPGNYQVRSRATNVCGATNWVFKDVSMVNCYYFSMYPNPASDYVTITLTVPEDDKGFRMPSEFRIKIMDNSGITHYSTTRSGNVFTIPVSQLRNGNYYVIINYGDKVESLPLVISK